MVLMVNLLVSDMVSAARIKHLQKRNSFVGIGCLGLFDNAKFNRLDKICEECYSVTRTSGIESSCRRNCFRNEEFLKCIDLLLYSNKNELNMIAETLYGS